MSMVAAFCLLLVSKNASAAVDPNAVAAPMCGERGESVEAPLIFRLSDGGVIQQNPCFTPEQLAAGGDAPLAPKSIVVHERPEQVLPFSSLRLTQAQTSRLEIGAAESPPRAPGYVSALFRPPRRA